MTISVSCREREPPALVTQHIVSRWRQAERIWPAEANVTVHSILGTLGILHWDTYPLGIFRTCIFCPLQDKSASTLVAINPLLLLSVTINVKLQESDPRTLATYGVVGGSMNLSYASNQNVN